MVVMAGAVVAKGEDNSSTHLRKLLLTSQQCLPHQPLVHGVVLACESASTDVYRQKAFPHPRVTHAPPGLCLDSRSPEWPLEVAPPGMAAILLHEEEEQL